MPERQSIEYTTSSVVLLDTRSYTEVNATGFKGRLHVPVAQIRECVERGDIDQDYFSPCLWESIICRVYSADEMPSLGGLILELFRNADSVVSHIHPDLQIVLNGSRFSEVPGIDEKGLTMIRDDMMRAFHR